MPPGWLPRVATGPPTAVALPPLSVQVHRSEGLIYMVLEFGDIDLARLLQVRGCVCGGGWGG